MMNRNLLLRMFVANFVPVGLGMGLVAAIKHDDHLNVAEELIGWAISGVVYGIFFSAFAVWSFRFHETSWASDGRRCHTSSRDRYGGKQQRVAFAMSARAGRHASKDRD